ncbi:response regulator transcription factor [Singulisphaera sp. PoT]|uniref:response regulator transcription factor n=1 Tax=Singulisphaera sp. PoT TaxID=3411797 RepID=UPI003BF5C44C
MTSSPWEDDGEVRRIKVMIVDDHPATREGLAIRISSEPDMMVCGEASDVSGALELIESRQPDIVVVDIALRASDGMDLIKQVRASNPSALLLVWSMYHETLYAERALRAGAMGYVNKTQATSTLIEAIRQMLDGKVYLSVDLDEKLVNRVVDGINKNFHSAPVESLSDRELEVFRMIGHGMNTGEIANRLRLSNKTVETYRDRIRAKLDLSTGTELSRTAFQWVLEHG